MSAGTGATTAPIKKANKPFLVHQRHKARVAAAKAANPNKQPSTLWVDVVSFVFVGLVIASAVSKMLHGNFFFGLHESPYLDIRTYLPDRTPRPDLLFTPEQLKRYDGSDPKLPLYLALNGSVYDVSANRRTYGPGGSYHHFAGVDGARAYATGCFRTHLTHDLRGLSKDDLEKVRSWSIFYDGHKTYRRVGRVLHPPIDPASPIPEDCKQRKSKPDA